jgi:protein-disulfide isomerase/uncharacterized membrane protein
LKNAFLVVFLAIGLLLSGLLLFAHHGEGPAVQAIASVCGETESGCTKVNTSPNSVFLGVPWAVYGAFFYASSLLLLALSAFASDEVAQGTRVVLRFLLILALVVDACLFFVQFSMKAYCVLCLTTYALNVGSLLLLLPFAPVQKAAGLKGKEGRLLLAGFTLGSAAVALALLSGEAALSLRETARAPQILGLGKEAPAGTADAEVKRLQGILDDPAKLDQYLNEKASRDFDEAPVRTIDLAGVPSRGGDMAPIHVVDYSDFLCPFCRQAAQGFAGWLPQVGGRVALYYKNFPLDMACNDRVHYSTHPGSCFLALGGICANDQGKFWAYHDKVFSTTNLQNPEAKDVLRLASEAGLDPAAMAACLDSPGTKSRLLTQIHEGSDAGVGATPTLFINGRKLPRIDHFVESVDKEARRLGLPPLPSPKP